MKKILIILYIIFSFGVSGFTQSTTVYTCNNGSVNASLLQAGTAAQKAGWRQEFLNWGASRGLSANDILAEASGAYNCHAYAWHLREGNTNQVWINNANPQVGNCFPETHNIDKYWTDGCFIRVCNVTDADKTHYYCGDHSAVSSTIVAGKFESKWGKWPVIRHDPTTVPYEQPSSVNYYASTKISGNTSGFCSGTRTFTVKNISGATYNWTYSSSLSVVGPINTNQITVQRNGSTTAPAWVSVQISTPCSGSPSVSRLDFTVGASPLSITSSISGCNGSFQVWNLVNNTPSYGSNWSWSVNYLSTPSSQINIYSPTSPSTFVSVTGGGAVRLSYTDQCGAAQTTGVTVYNNGCFGYRVAVSPNPAKNNMSVSLIPESSNPAITNATVATVNTTPIKSISSTGKTIMSLFEINTNLLVKQWVHNEVSNPNYNFNLNGLRKGVYILQIDRNNTATTTKVIIE